MGGGYSGPDCITLNICSHWKFAWEVGGGRICDRKSFWGSVLAQGIISDKSAGAKKSLSNQDKWASFLSNKSKVDVIGSPISMASFPSVLFSRFSPRRVRMTMVHKGQFDFCVFYTRTGRYSFPTAAGATNTVQ